MNSRLISVKAEESRMKIILVLTSLNRIPLALKEARQEELLIIIALCTDHHLTLWLEQKHFVHSLCTLHNALNVCLSEVFFFFALV